MVRSGLGRRAGVMIVLPLALLISLLTALPSAGEGEAIRPIPARIPPHAEIPDDKLTGENIYERVLDNRFDTYVQVSSLVSGDRGGNSQTTQLRMWFESLRDVKR